MIKNQKIMMKMKLIKVQMIRVKTKIMKIHLQMIRQVQMILRIMRGYSNSFQWVL